MYFLKKRIARRLPKYLLRGPMRIFNSSPLSMDGECLRKTGNAALWPIFEVWNQLENWFHMDRVKEVLRQSETGDVLSLRRLQCIQAFAYRLIDN